MVHLDVEKTLSALDLEEKVALTAGKELIEPGFYSKDD
jgi:hypothetical protein